MRTLDEHKLRRLIDVGRALTSDLDLEVVLRRVLHTARELTGARYAALGILDESRQEVERFLAVGFDEATREEVGDAPKGRGVLGALIRDPKPLRLPEVGAHPSSYGFPPGHPPMTSFLGVPIIVRGRAYGNLYLTDKESGEPFDEADEDSAVVLAEWASVAIENARLYTRVERRRSDLERAVRGLEATTAVTTALGGETELDRVLELVAKRGRALVEARTLVVLLAETDGFSVASVAGEAGAGLTEVVVPLDSVPGQVLRTRRPERIPDIPSRLRHSLEELGVSARSALLVPLAFRGQDHGVICAFDRLTRGPQFDADDEEALVGFASAAVTAVATARSVEHELLQHSIEVQELERKRWARELHDQTLQGLGALQLVLSTALGSGAPERVEAAARDAIELLGGEIEGLREIITDLRPAALDELGVQPAIEALAARVATTSGIKVDTAIGLAEARLQPDVENAIYRLVQEGVTNAAKHSGASRVRVSIDEHDGTVEIVVEDDGAGFDPEADTAGFGLVGMHERVALAGGRLEVQTGPGEGTAVRAAIPVRPRQASAQPRIAGQGP